MTEALGISLRFAAAAALALLAVRAEAAVFSPQTFALANGMQVVVIPNHRAPIVIHMVWYKVGSADESPGRSGIAHFLEHLMFKGTRDLEPGEFSKIVARHGGRENAFTSSDYTAYFQTVATDRLELVMRMEADRMTNLVLTSAEIETERQVVLEERRQRTDNVPSARLREYVNATLFLNHPYRLPVIGWEHEIRALTRDDILAFYRSHYAPNNAVLVVAGDITAERLRPLAEKYYGPIPAVAATPRPRPQEPVQEAPRQVSLRDPRVKQPSWSRVYLAPSYQSTGAEHAYALQVLNEIVGSSATSRLHRILVVERELADTAGSSYDPDNLGPSQFGVHASPRAGVALETLESAVAEEIAKLVAAGVTAEEVARAQRRMKAQAIYARDSLRTGAQVLGAALAGGRSVAEVESWPERIAAVTVEQVNAAAKEVLREGRSVTARLLPGETP